MGDVSVKVAYSVVRSLAVSVLSGTSLIDRFVKSIVHPEQKTVLYSSRPAPIPTINELWEEHKDKIDKTQVSIMTKEERGARLVGLARIIQISPKWERIMLVFTDTRERVQFRLLLEWHSTKACIITTGMIDAIPSRPFTLSVRDPTNAPLSVVGHQQVATALSSPSLIKHDKFEESPMYISSPRIHRGVTFVHHRPHVHSLQQTVGHKH